eukprot:3631311-Rhodomonas_salina.1
MRVPGGMKNLNSVSSIYGIPTRRVGALSRSGVHAFEASPVASGGSKITFIGAQSPYSAFASSG